MPHEVATRHFLRRTARAQARRLSRYAKPDVHYSVRQSPRGPYRYVVYREVDRKLPAPQFETREQRNARINRLKDNLQ